MKTLNATFIIEDKKTGKLLVEPYYKLKGREKRWIREVDVQSADWRDEEGIIQAAFNVGCRCGAGDLIRLDCDDDAVYLSTTDKINR